VVDDIEADRLNRHVRSVYPRIGRGERLEGNSSVIVRGVLEPDGRLTRVRLTRSMPRYDDAVMKMVRAWRLTPATVDGAPVRTDIVARVRIHTRPPS
jgi:TonB family protein